MADEPVIERHDHRFTASTYTVHPTEKQPRSFLNQYTMLGMSLATAAYTGMLLFGPALVGGTLGALLGIPSTNLWGLAALAAGVSAVGAVAGNAYNNHVANVSERDGIPVSPPSFFNKGLLRGALSGFSMGTLLPLFATYFLNPGAALIAGGAALLGSIGAVIGGIKGSSEESQQQQQRYDMVQQHYFGQTGQLDLSQDKGSSLGTALTVGAAAVGVAATAAGLHHAVAAAAPMAGSSLSVQNASMQVDPNFTAYAHPADAWHPADERQDSFAKKFRPERSAPMPQQAVTTPSLGLSIDPQQLATQIQAMREGQETQPVAR